MTKRTDIFYVEVTKRDEFREAISSHSRWQSSGSEVLPHPSPSSGGRSSSSGHIAGAVAQTAAAIKGGGVQKGKGAKKEKDDNTTEETPSKSKAKAPGKSDAEKNKEKSHRDSFLAAMKIKKSFHEASSTAVAMIAQISTQPVCRNRTRNTNRSISNLLAPQTPCRADRADVSGFLSGRCPVRPGHQRGQTQIHLTCDLRICMWVW
jgi:hypothetical protein